MEYLRFGLQPSDVGIFYPMLDYSRPDELRRYQTVDVSAEVDAPAAIDGRGKGRYMKPKTMNEVASKIKYKNRVPPKLGPGGIPPKNLPRFKFRG
jgi:hypothetical protein